MGSRHRFIVLPEERKRPGLIVEEEQRQRTEERSVLTISTAGNRPTSNLFTETAVSVREYSLWCAVVFCIYAPYNA